MARKRKTKKKPTRRRHGPIPGGLEAHGAFTRRTDADAKADKIGKRAFVGSKSSRALVAAVPQRLIKATKTQGRPARPSTGRRVALCVL